MTADKPASGKTIGRGGFAPDTSEQRRAAGRGRGKWEPAWHQLIPPHPGSPLRLDIVDLSAGAELRLGSDSDSHQLVYVLSGSVELTRGEQQMPITVETAFLCDATIPVIVSAHTPTSLAVFGAEAGCDEHAPLGERTASTRLDLGSSESATGRRSFQVLLGPENGCCRATMFVGLVPPGAAPWHFHQYDEIVYLLDGAARYHEADASVSLTTGDAVRIPPRTMHINENVSDSEMRVLGVFTPAGSPSAAYLADRSRPS